MHLTAPGRAATQFHMAPTPAAHTPPPLGPHTSWRAFAGRGLTSQVLCLAIALLIWLLSQNHGGFATVWIYSAAIGTCCWFFIDGSRVLLVALLEGRRLAHAGPPMTRPRWPGALWMLACIGVGTLAGYSLGSSIGDKLTGNHTPGLLQNTGMVVLTLLAAAGATWHFYSQERLHREQAAAESARRLATENQLRLLQSQLEPHMLFNTLANLRVLITLDPPRAQAMLDRLIGFLRATLNASRQDLHPLSAEFDRLADYLALMAVRMGPRLAVTLDLPAMLRDLAVPPLLLQPLVENAIQHGLEPQVEGGRLTVRASTQQDQLVLSVHDDGMGLTTSGPSQGQRPFTADGQAAAPALGGYGTQHVRQRLAAMYGPAAQFTLVPAAGGGTLAELRLPLHAGLEAPSAALTPTIATPNQPVPGQPQT